MSRIQTNNVFAPVTNLGRQFFQDEAGFIVSAELILVATILILSLVVGLSELSTAVNQELEDVASAFGSVNQSFRYQGHAGCKGFATGSFFNDNTDECDSTCDITCQYAPQAEGSSYGH